MIVKSPRQHDNKHLDFIRSLICVACLDNTSVEAAHVRFSDARAAKKNPGNGAKPHDYWTVPLCSRCHREQHSMDEEKFWFGQTGIDPIFVALALYVNSGDHEAGMTIIREQH